MNATQCERVMLVRTTLSPRAPQATAFAAAGFLAACSYQGELVSAKAEPTANTRPEAQALPPSSEAGPWRPIALTLKPATLKQIRSRDLYVRAYLSDCEGAGTGLPHELYFGDRSITSSPSNLRGAPLDAANNVLVLYVRPAEMGGLTRLCVSVSGGSMLGATFSTKEIPVAF